MKALKKLFGFPGKKLTVFVVEDSDIFRDMLSRFIIDIDKNENFNEKVSYDVQTFTSGEEAIQALDKNPDIVVLDYQLEPWQPRAKSGRHMNGLQTLEAIKKLKPEVEAVMVTAKGNFSVNTEALGAGAAEYIEKGPGIREKLQQTVAGLMKKILGESEGVQPAIA